MLRINLHAEGKYEEIIFYYAQDGGGREMLSGEVEKIRINYIEMIPLNFTCKLNLCGNFQ